MKGKILEYRGHSTILRHVGRLKWHLWIAGVTPADKPYVIWGTESWARSRQKDEEARIEHSHQEAERLKPRVKRVVSQHKEGRHSGDWQNCARCQASRKAIGYE